MAESPVASAAFCRKSASVKPRPALRVMDYRHLEERTGRALVIEQLFGQEGEVSDVIDDCRSERSPALRMTGASPSWRPRTMAGSTRWSRQQTTSNSAAGTPSAIGL